MYVFIWYIHIYIYIHTVYAVHIDIERKWERKKHDYLIINISILCVIEKSMSVNFIKRISFVIAKRSLWQDILKIRYT